MQKMVGLIFSPRMFLNFFLLNISCSLILVCGKMCNLLSGHPRETGGGCFNRGRCTLNIFYHLVNFLVNMNHVKTIMIKICFQECFYQSSLSLSGFYLSSPFPKQS